MKWNFQHRIIILMVMLLMGITGIQAQNGRKHPAFDPKKFQAELEQYITTNAALTPGEAARFFPMYQLQQEYHARFLTVLPASKVLSVIRAEEKFHRQAFRRMHK